MLVEPTFKNLSAIQLSDNALRLTVIPAWGEKVAEIFDVRRGRKWLDVP